MWDQILTGFGYWDVYAWILFFLISGGMVYLIRSLGRKDYKRDTDQDEIFFGSNPVPEDGEALKVPASSAYWGYTKALKPFYDILVGLHTGIATDYAGWYILITAMVAVLILL
jgi:hypothetical protein